jgi:hypothetical protein
VFCAVVEGLTSLSLNLIWQFDFGLHHLFFRPRKSPSIRFDTRTIKLWTHCHYRAILSFKAYSVSS